MAARAQDQGGLTISVVNWVLVGGFTLSYHNRETILLTVDPIPIMVTEIKSPNRNPVKVQQSSPRDHSDGSLEIWVLL